MPTRQQLHLIDRLAAIPYTGAISDGDVHIQPGDFVVGDRDGVAIIPRSADSDISDTEIR